MTQTSPEQRYERMADEVEDSLEYGELFDPLATMDSVKWAHVLANKYPWWLPGDVATVADLLEGRHFKGWV